MNTSDRTTGDCPSVPEPSRAGQHATPKPQRRECPECGKEIPFPGPHTARAVQQWNRDDDSARPIYCSPCIKRLEQKRCAEQREAEAKAEHARLTTLRANIAEALEEVGVPPRWRDASLDACPDLPEDLLSELRTYAENPDGIVYLYGQQGAGKSWAAVAVLREILLAGLYRPRQASYTSERDFLGELRASYDAGQSRSAPASRHPTSHHGARLLLLDDVGSTRLTEWGKGEIAALIEHRHAEALPTIITSNLTPDKLGAVVDGRIVSRIAEDRRMLGFPPRDLRVDGTIRQSAQPDPVPQPVDWTKGF